MAMEGSREGFSSRPDVPPRNEAESPVISDRQLDLKDPFEKAIYDIVRMNRVKRKDYAIDGSPWSNFDNTAALMGMEGFGPAESAYFNVCQKLARLQALRANGRMRATVNETVQDTYLDLAVYACILYSIARGK